MKNQVIKMKMIKNNNNNRLNKRNYQNYKNLKKKSSLSNNKKLFSLKKKLKKNNK